eukprot:SAG31_NODE_41981_length_273_cov_1.183908_1_plen_61_part_01
MVGLLHVSVQSPLLFMAHNSVKMISGVFWVYINIRDIWVFCRAPINTLLNCPESGVAPDVV